MKPWLLAGVLQNNSNNDKTAGSQVGKADKYTSQGQGKLWMPMIQKSVI